MPPLLKVSNLKKHFPAERGWLLRLSGWVKAVDGVSFQIDEGETLGLVGESGCGKTTLGRTILRLLEPTGGEIIFAGTKLGGMPPKDLRRFRRRMQIIFQDPYSSLNPRMSAGTIIGESLIAHGLVQTKREQEELVKELLRKVGLSPHHIRWYPHEFSGGMRQRIGIARALALNPRFIVCDEPVSALDVSIQAQILNLLKDLQQKMNLSYLFISHDLRVVGHVSDRIAVMYLGKLVEIVDKRELFRNPRHPYTKILTGAIPQIGGKREKTLRLRGEPPGFLNLPSGCLFHPRCPLAKEICSRQEPQLEEKGKKHFVACQIISA